MSASLRIAMTTADGLRIVLIVINITFSRVPRGRRYRHTFLGRGDSRDRAPTRPIGRLRPQVVIGMASIAIHQTARGFPRLGRRQERNMRMNSPVRSAGRARIATLAAALGTCILVGPSARSDDGPSDAVNPHGDAGVNFGTLGWAPYGSSPGFYGFSLRYHLGYGYGRGALGVGADGGYPFYGGPGYDHPGPPLERCGPIVPFAYYSGPGYPYNFAPPGPLVVAQPVAAQTQGGDAAHAAGSAVYPYDVGFGPFTGAYPYPESYFAPFTAAAAARGSAAGPATLAPANADPVRVLGIDEESVVDNRGMRGMKVWRVYPGSPAEAAGLKPGDVIRAINDYRTEQPGNVAWIIANAAPDKVLKLKVQAEADGAEHTITARIP
jgi:hypothetical protein